MELSYTLAHGQNCSYFTPVRYALDFYVGFAWKSLTAKWVRSSIETPPCSSSRFHSGESGSEMVLSLLFLSHFAHWELLVISSMGRNPCGAAQFIKHIAISIAECILEPRSVKVQVKTVWRLENASWGSGHICVTGSSLVSVTSYWLKPGRVGCPQSSHAACSYWKRSCWLTKRVFCSRLESKYSYFCLELVSLPVAITHS